MLMMKMNSFSVSSVIGKVRIIRIGWINVLIRFSMSVVISVELKLLMWMFLSR